MYYPYVRNAIQNSITTANSTTQTHADAGTSRGKFDAIRAEYSVEDVKIITNTQSLSKQIHELLSSDVSKLEDDEIGDLKQRLEGLQKEFVTNFEKVDGDEDSGWVCMVCLDEDPNIPITILPCG